MNPQQPVKSLQECKDEIAIKHTYTKWPEFVNDHIIDDLCELYASQFQRQEAEGWVKVSDRLPEEHRQIVCLIEDKFDGNYPICGLYKENKLYNLEEWPERIELVDVISWRELPSPPESK